MSSLVNNCVRWCYGPLILCCLPTIYLSSLFSIFVSLWVWHLWCVWCVSVGFGSSAGSCSSSAGAPAVTDNQSSTSVWKNLTPFLTQSSFNSDMLDFLTWTSSSFTPFLLDSVGLGCSKALFLTAGMDAVCSYEAAGADWGHSVQHWWFQQTCHSTFQKHPWSISLLCTTKNNSGSILYRSSIKLQKTEENVQDRRNSKGNPVSVENRRACADQHVSLLKYTRCGLKDATKPHQKDIRDSSHHSLDSLDSFSFTIIWNKENKRDWFVSLWCCMAHFLLRFSSQTDVLIVFFTICC